MSDRYFGLCWCKPTYSCQMYLYVTRSRAIGSSRDSHNRRVIICAEGMAPREGSNDGVRIGGDSFQGSPPCFTHAESFWPNQKLCRELIFLFLIFVTGWTDKNILTLKISRFTVVNRHGCLLCYHLMKWRVYCCHFCCWIPYTLIQEFFCVKNICVRFPCRNFFILYDNLICIQLLATVYRKNFVCLLFVVIRQV